MRALLCLLLVGCGSFEDPTIVLDLRVLGMRATPPEQIVDVDLEQPDVTEILAQLDDVDIEAIVADPGRERPLRWSMTLCLLDEVDEARCDRTKPTIEIGSAVIDDPDSYHVPQPIKATLVPNTTMLAMINEAIRDNPVEAIGGVRLSVVLTVGDLDDASGDVYAAKHLRISPRFPSGRSANANPTLEFVDAALPNGQAVNVQTMHCGEALANNPDAIPAVQPGARVTLFPVERADTREMYLAPTLDGRPMPLEETITYQWLSTYGAWSDEFTGGGHDALGNQSLLGSDWIAPAVSSTLTVSLWMIQRDERFGVNWFQTCIIVDP